MTGPYWKALLGAERMAKSGRNYGVSRYWFESEHKEGKEVIKETDDYLQTSRCTELTGQWYCWWWGGNKWYGSAGIGY